VLALFEEKLCEVEPLLPAFARPATPGAGRPGGRRRGLSAGHFQKKALLVISDGQSRNSQRTAREVRDRLRESEVKVFAVGGGDPYGESLADLGAFVLAGGTARKGGPESLPDVEAAVGRAILDELTRASGGYAHFSFLTTEPQFDEACSRIAGELRQQYVIGFYPAAPADDAGWHKLEVRVNAPRRRGELSLSYRDRYRLGKR
jgi:Ca-activated chloride channel family protein